MPRLSSIVAGVCLLFVCSDAFAWLYVIPHDQLTDPLLGLSGEYFTPDERQVHVPILGYMINSSGHYYFQGETSDLNEFLRRALEATNSEYLRSQTWYREVSSEVVIHTGAKTARLPGSKSDDPAEPAQWKLSLLRNSRLISDRSKTIHTLKVQIHVWIDGAIRLDDLKVPERFAVVSGGEIEQFILEHSDASDE